MGKINKFVISGAAIGLILALSQPPYNLGILVFPGFVLFFLALNITTWRRSSQVKSNRPFWLGYLTGLVYFLISFKWYWTVYPLKNMGIDNISLGFFLVFFIWIVTAGSLALAWGISAGWWKKLDSPISWSTLLVFPSVFTIMEYLRSHLIGLVWIGQQTSPGPDWTIGNLAYNLHNSFFALKLSSWFGIYGVTFAVVFLSFLLFIFLEKRKYKQFLILTATLLILVYGPLLWKFSLNSDLGGKDKIIEVAAIQTSIPSQLSYTPTEEASFFKNQLELIGSVSKNFPETKLIVFPEESNFFKTFPLFRNTAEASGYFSGLFPQRPSEALDEERSSVLIIDNSKVITGLNFQSKTIFLDSQRGVLGSYDKHLLTPGGEFIPLIFRALNKILGLNLAAIQNTTEYQAGTKPPEGIVGPNGLVAASLICSDIFSPNLIRNTTRIKNLNGSKDLAFKSSGSNVLVSQSSFGFAKGARDLLAQDLAAAKFRASETGRYLVKASNFGYSYIISDQGLLKKITPNLDWQILTGSVVLKEGRTLYNKVGDRPILWASLAVLIVSMFLRLPTRSASQYFFERRRKKLYFPESLDKSKNEHD